MSARGASFRSIVVCATLALLVAGCSLQPVYRQPAPAIPDTWPSGDAYRQRVDGDVPTIDYHALFRDPRLQTLIERAIVNNQNLRVALANVESARGTLRVTRAALFPQFGAGSGITGQQIAGTAASANRGSQVTSYDANVGLSTFEIDLFGRVRSLSDAALLEYLGTEQAARATRLTLIGEIASTYLTIATDRSLLKIARETQDTASRSVELTRARLAGGIAPRSDLSQAQTVLAQAEADLAAQTTLVAQDRNALELLVGAPAADAELPTSIESVDGLLDELPAGLDSRVLLGRPDVVQAEYQLRAANARIGAARAAFFPTISLTAAAGFASNALSTLVAANSFAWSIAPSIGIPLFDAGFRQGNLDIANAQRDAAVANYQNAIQSAFRDVADALARRGTIAEQFRAQADLEAAAQNVFYLADARYREGVDPFLNSLDAQRTLYTARRSLALIRRQRADNLVQIYRSIGNTS